ncbi:MAG: hypothetical protein CVU39_25985 [Chloroflexi bacterium HGW-Chloroflexi-10]|nr:MAG: hypothetical protein CVU39_25985 [Chloroflexi bacterium HGW-Chloroflexi-10]
MFRIDLLPFWIYLLIGMFSLVLIIPIYVRRRVPGSGYLAMHILSLAIWTIAVALETASTNQAAKILFNKVSYIGFANIVPFLLIFLLLYFGKLNQPLPRKIILLWLLPVFVILAAWTNEWHALVWPGFGAIDSQTNFMVYEHGPFFWVGIIYIYLLMFFILFFMWDQWHHSSHRTYRWQSMLILVGGVFPMATGTFYLSNINPVLGMDWTPIGSFFSLVFITVAIYAFRFMDAVPVAREIVLSNMQDGVLVLGVDQQVLDWNAAFRNLFPFLTLRIGIPAAEILTQLKLPAYLFHHESRAVRFEVELEAPHLGIFEVCLNVIWQGERFSGWLLIFHVVTQERLVTRALKNANQHLQERLVEIEGLQIKLKEQAIRDPLTGLFNRRYFSETLERELAQAVRTQSPLSLLMIDIDNFKLVNDQLGHVSGDDVLKRLGDILSFNTRKGDVACRFGGEEFMVLLVGAKVDQARDRALNIQEVFADACRNDPDLGMPVTMSVGISSFPEASDSGELIRRVDQALYAAKRAGRDKIVIWEDGLAK